MEFLKTDNLGFCLIGETLEVRAHCANFTGRSAKPCEKGELASEATSHPEYGKTKSLHPEAAS